MPLYRYSKEARLLLRCEDYRDPQGSESRVYREGEK